MNWPLLIAGLGLSFAGGGMLSVLPHVGVGIWLAGGALFWLGYKGVIQ